MSGLRFDPGLRDEALRAVGSERLWQEQLKVWGKFKTTCADTGMTHAERLAVLVEEVGEAATEVMNGRENELRYELIQVAAVAVAWIEALYREGETA